MEALIVLTLICATISLSTSTDPLCAGVPPGAIVLFPYPTDCSKYYECVDGQKIERDCPTGYWFNAALQACDHPDHSGCTPSTEAPTTTTSPTTSSSFCPVDGVDYLPYPGDCTKYYECYYGTVEIHTCPSDLWFNAAEKRCVYPEDSDCVETTSSVRPTWTTPDEVCWGVLPGITELKPYPGDCNKFIECYGARRTDMTCPPHLYFNAAKQMCDWPSVSGCDDTTVTPPPSTTEGSTITPPTTPSGDDDPRCYNGNTDYWPHPDCTKYIECYKGHGYTMDCPSGLYFDSVDKKCEDPSQSDCGRTTPTMSPDTTTKQHDWTPDPDCPWPWDGPYLFPYPGDCTKFWECAEGEKVARDCPPDLWFNPTLLVCDYPYHSGCVWGKLFKHLE